MAIPNFERIHSFLLLLRCRTKKRLELLSTMELRNRQKRGGRQKLVSKLKFFFFWWSFFCVAQFWIFWLLWVSLTAAQDWTLTTSLRKRVELRKRRYHRRRRRRRRLHRRRRRQHRNKGASTSNRWTTRRKWTCFLLIRWNCCSQLVKTTLARCNWFWHLCLCNNI